MSRLVLALLVVVMLSLTSYVAYSMIGTPDAAASPAAATTDCSQPAHSCCTEAATATEATPGCCQEKAKCCESKGEAGACCESPSKAQAIAGDRANEKPKTAPKKD